jgi:hypothetical protein
MTDALTLALEAAIVVVQVAAAYYSYEVYRYDRLHRQWLAVTLALVLMACQSGALLASGSGMFPGFSVVAEVTGKVTLPFIISVFFLAGMWSMKVNFEKFDVIERKTTEKIKQFNQSRKSEKNNGK